MDRYAVVSADCHVFGPGNGSNSTEQLSLLTPYFESRYRDDYEGYAQKLEEAFAERTRMAGLFSDESLNSFSEQEAVLSGGTTGLWDSDRRIKELEADGVVAEVIFPNGLPFNALGTGSTYSYELQAAGMRAYNRWLADFCRLAPERRAGLAVVDPRDIEGAV